MKIKSKERWRTDEITCRHISWKGSCLHCTPILGWSSQSPSQDLQKYFRNINNPVFVSFNRCLYFQPLSYMPVPDKYSYFISRSNAFDWMCTSELEKKLCAANNSVLILQCVIILAFYSISVFLLWLLQKNYSFWF